MKKLKYLIFGLRNLVIAEDKADSSKGHTDLDGDDFQEFTKLLNYVRSQDITPVVFANHDWKFGKDGKTAQEVLTKKWGKVEWIIASELNLPYKPQAAAMQAVLKRLGCEANEVLYIGNTVDDMRTAVNGEVLFLNGTWISDSIEYGFKFSSPKAIAKFIDVFCVRSHGWHFAIEQGRLRYYSLAPFSTMKPEFEAYSANARNTAKFGTGDAKFWGRYLVATMFLTGLYKDFEYVCPFPSHKANTWNNPVQDSISRFIQCFRGKYLPDLIVRHATSLKAQHNPTAMNHAVHLDSIHLNAHPQKNSGGGTYVNCPLKNGKTVLILDDICTQGFSMEAARAYMEKAGAGVILVSWLKTINRPFQELATTGGFKFDPFKPTNWDGAKLKVVTHQYKAAMDDDQAYKELKEKFERYKKWEWPEDV